MVGRRECIIDASQNDQEPVLLRFFWVFLPTALLCTTAGALWASLYQLDGPASCKQYYHWFSQAAAKAGDVIKFRCVDGAGSNARLFDKEAWEDGGLPNVYNVLKHCHCHCANIGSTSTFNCGLFGTMTADKYIAVKFYSMSGFFIRMLFSIPSVCGDEIRPTSTKPHGIWDVVAEGLISLCCLGHKTSKVFEAYLGSSKLVSRLAVWSLATSWMP